MEYDTFSHYKTLHDTIAYNIQGSSECSHAICFFALGNMTYCHTPYPGTNVNEFANVQEKR